MRPVKVSARDCTVGSGAVPAMGNPRSRAVSVVRGPIDTNNGSWSVRRSAAQVVAVLEEVSSTTSTSPASSGSSVAVLRDLPTRCAQADTKFGPRNIGVRHEGACRGSRCCEGGD